ncbi:MAG: GAF domain-containing sensor histidine kinase [Anaerolineales bacterium]|nr:GAF domain-containing sensor histidine kinase [Anaerolineales bacterium]MCX7755030.1 GAF domain-containing sensor histidine kinase [Anaerolineales bacterium]MDW8279240.1 GAF domain-containing protein [Anaerolineales bacterium]
MLPSPDLNKRLAQLERLVEVSLILNSTQNLEDLLQSIIKTATEILDCEAASILLYDEKRNRLFFAAATGSDPKKLAQIPVPLDGSLAGTIFREEQAILLNDVRQDPRHYGAVGQQIDFQPRSLLGVPMKIKEKGVGVLEALNKRQGDFSPEDVKLLSVVASQAAIAIHNAQLIRALQKAYEDISETDRLKSNFLALASHELRTPLGIIIGYASFLQESNLPDVTENAERVLAAATQMRSIIESMTSLHLLQARGLTFKPRVVPVQQVLRAAYEEMRAIAEEMRHSVVLQLPPQSLLVTADPDKLTPAFVNILNNAIRFTPPGGQITISAVNRGGSVLVSVSDTGIGIAPEHLTKIFQEFYQVEPHTTRRFGGLGIGLTIAKGLIETQGGRIWAESEGLGKGTTLRVVLPPAGTASLSVGP